MNIAEKLDGAADELELWAGVECTQNRIGDQYFEQLDRTGHSLRISDLDLLADLGAQAIRQPVLWERVSSEGSNSFDWNWSDQWLRRISELKLRPIIGLLHHGSGPCYTNLLDKQFPEQLAAYARAVAERYPWARDYTPVNEPLTTARFSGLYGHWYPHGRDDRTFVRCLLNECRATVLAMQAIREVVPDARLIQTEDLGFTHSSPVLRYQAEFENQRRWLSFDLLCGRVNQEHPLWQYLLKHGATPGELFSLCQNASPPDLLGVNYYLSSERFLHEKLFLYPRGLRGGNGRHSYVDIEAARVRTDGLRGAAELMLDIWQRYRLPLAITECHNGCSREEQLRWIREVWSACEDVRSVGGAVRAFTLWASFGSFDWNSLVTQARGDYEPGVFDIRSPRPRPTAIVSTIKNIRTPEAQHPLLKLEGWWRRRDRHPFGFSVLDSGAVIPVSKMQQFASCNFHDNIPRVLIAGSGGTLAGAFARVCDLRGIPYSSLSRKEFDIADEYNVCEVLRRLRPWAVINAAGYVRVDEAEREVERCYRENAQGAAVLALACANRGVQLLTFSSDLVFNGKKETPYVESDSVDALNVYGCSKVLAETEVASVLPSALIVRTSAFFGPWDEYNFATMALRKLFAGESVSAADDCRVSPTYVPDLVNNALDLLIDGERGIWHLANRGAVSWFGFATLAAQQVGISTERLICSQDFQTCRAAQMPANSVLGSNRGCLMPTLADALVRYANECRRRFSRSQEPLAA